MAKKKYTPKAFAEAVEKYFRSITYLRSATDAEGNTIYNADGAAICYSDFAIPPSITDLCVRLDICKDTFDAYMRDDRYAETCRRAKLLIEAWLERQLDTREKSVDGIKFNLTYNFGWSGERREVELGEATREAVSAAAIPMQEKLALITAVYGEIAGAGSSGQSGANDDGANAADSAASDRPVGDDDDTEDVHALGGVGYYDDEDSPHGTVDHTERD